MFPPTSTGGCAPTPAPAPLSRRTLLGVLPALLVAPALLLPAVADPEPLTADEWLAHIQTLTPAARYRMLHALRILGAGTLGPDPTADALWAAAGEALAERGLA